MHWVSRTCPPESFDMNDKNSPETLKTARLILRRWQKADLEPFSQLNKDERVMEFFPKTLSENETRTFIATVEMHFEREGCGLWVVELPETGEFAGFVGLSKPRFQAHFTPCIEVGWRLSPKHWGKGFAPEAAREAVRDGFERLGLDEIVSFTARQNKKSIRVMEKIGMTTNIEDDFEHPSLPEGHHLRWHVLYRLKKGDWELLPKI